MTRYRFWPAVFISISMVCVFSTYADAVTPRQRASITTAAQIVRSRELVGVPLPAPGALAPSATAQLFPTPLPRHVVLGFIGATGFSGVTPSELTDVSELVTNMAILTATGAPSTKSPGWFDLNEPGFLGFVTAAHNAHDRVLLGVASGSKAALAKMLRHPGTGATRLASAIEPILHENHLDGIDLDFEGGTLSESDAFTTFTTVLQHALDRASTSTELVVNVAPSSASTAGFFNVRSLANVASALFVMDYDLTPGGAAGPNAPLSASAPQISVLSSLLAYTRVVPASKIILGVPFYGYDFPTKSSAPGSPTSGPADSVTYDNIVTVGHAAHWDAASFTPYYVFRRGKSWHETYYDDPVSVALKTALASVFHLSGVGVWSLGQEGSSTAMLSALDGGTSPLRLAITER